jgi:hypothetical protein
MRLGTWALVTLIGSAGTAFGQIAPADTAPYCTDLKRIVALAVNRLGFESIAGRPREGDFRLTTLPLPGWRECSLYGRTTYTCDSRVFQTVDKATQAHAQDVDQILSCLAGAWSLIEDRSSPGYAVLHAANGLASMTVSLDQTGNNEHIVRLTLFTRAR